MLQDTVWLISVALIAGFAGIFLWVAVDAPRRADAEAVQRRAYRLRTGWFWVLVAVIALATAMTLTALPYPARAPQAASRVSMRVTGAQWSWTIEGPDIVVGRPVEFQVSSSDVNHGFGIYNPSIGSWRRPRRCRVTSTACNTRSQRLAPTTSCAWNIAGLCIIR